MDKKRLLKFLDFFRSLSLQTKLIVLYIVIIIAPAIIFLLYFSNNIYKTMLDNVIKRNLYMIETDQIEINNNIEIMRSVSQYIVSDKELLSYLETTAPLDTDELIDFNSSTLNMLTRVKFNNPTIENLRVFSNNEYINEVWPILFYEKRIENTEWYSELFVRDGREFWVFEEKPEDIIKRHYHMYSGGPLVSLVRELRVGRDNHLGVVQVSMVLKDFIPKMYNPIEENTAITLIMDSNQNLFYNPESNFFKENQLSPQFIKKYYSKLDPNQTSYIQFSYNNTPYLMVYSYIKPLNAYLINIEALYGYHYEAMINRITVLFATIFLVLILSIISYNLISHELSNLYVLMKKMKMVERGNLDVKVPVNGPKEIRELATYFQQMIDRIKELIIETIKKEAATKNAELRALKTQIDAHFLYNTLENIKMMAELEEKYEISDALTSLSDMLRYNMNWNEEFVELRQELNHIKNYVDIMNLRTSQRIRLEIFIPDELMKQEIPKMSLQPLVENAIKHGIYPIIHERQGRITIEAVTNDDKVRIDVTDNGRGISEAELQRLNDGVYDIPSSERLDKGSGLGLRNVHERIELSYGKDYGLKITSEKGSFTKVSITLPFRQRGK